jgi:hypothetical protein
MKLSIPVLFMTLVLGGAAAPALKRGENVGCTDSTNPDGSITKRCPIPWTKNYGEYEKRAEDANDAVPIPWTKNYGEYDEE